MRYRLWLLVGVKNLEAELRLENHTYILGDVDDASHIMSGQNHVDLDMSVARQRRQIGQLGGVGEIIAVDIDDNRGRIISVEHRLREIECRRAGFTLPVHRGKLPVYLKRNVGGHGTLRHLVGRYHAVGGIGRIFRRIVDRVAWEKILAVADLIEYDFLKSYVACRDRTDNGREAELDRSAGDEQRLILDRKSVV